MIRGFAFGAALLSASPAIAAVELDQEAFTLVGIGTAPVIATIGEVAPQPPRVPVTTQRSAVQTFTAGLSGTLDHLEFQAGQIAAASGLVLMSLIDGDYLAGASTVVWQDVGFFANLPPIGVAGSGVLALFFDVSGAGYQVSAGQRYSVLFEGVPFQPNQNIGLVIGKGTLPGPTPPVFTGPGYAGGTFQGYFNGVAVPAVSDFDVGFRSFVDVSAAVPEPASWAMMIAGFGLAGAALRRRPKVRVSFA